MGDVIKEVGQTNIFIVVNNTVMSDRHFRQTHVIFIVYFTLLKVSFCFASHNVICLLVGLYAWAVTLKFPIFRFLEVECLKLIITNRKSTII